jgi:ribokinase
MRCAVVGHVEWTEFVHVAQVPAPGEIVEARESWQEPAGGGAVAAVQIAKLGGECLFVTALGDDDLGHRAARELAAMGLEVAVAWRAAPQRRAFVHLDDGGQRTITTIGERHRPTAGDALPWAEFERVDAAYVTAADPEALRRVRAARRVVATVRAGPALAEAGVVLDVLVLSANDPGERYLPGELDPPPRAVVRTAGEAGGTRETADGAVREWEAPPPPGPRVDVHGAGDSFAGGLTYGLGAGRPLDGAVELGARCGAAATTGRGPYGNQLIGDSPGRPA